MDAPSRDLRFAFRLIRKAPVLSIATIVTLAAGIGLNAGVFTVLSGLLLRPRVTVNPDTFVHLQPEYSGTHVPRHESAAFSTRDYLAIRDRTTTLSMVTAWSVRGTGIGAVAPFRELTMLISCGFFDVYALGSLAAGLMAGLAPAIESLRQRLTPMLAGQDMTARIGGRFGIRDVLIAAQIGMSLVLVAGTVIFLRAERAIALRDPSVDAAHVLMVPYNPLPGTSAALMPALSSRLQQLPGVRGSAFAVSGEAPFGDAPLLVVRGREISTERTVPISVVSASFFEVMRRPMLQGHGFVEEQAPSAIQPIVISDVLARVWWPEGSAVGAQLDANDGRRYEVVGVVHADVAFTAGTADSIQAFVLPPSSPSPGDFFLRFDGDAVALQSLVRNVLRDLTPTAVGDPVTLAAADANAASKVMPLVKMVGSLGVIAIVLALVGVYGVVSFAVGRRTREIGVRIALGATRGDITRMVVSSAAPPIAAGIAVGLVLLIPAGIALTRVFRDTPVPLHPTDPLTYAGVVIALGAVALVTMLVPARRASAVPPSEALRTE